MEVSLDTSQDMPDELRVSINDAMVSLPFKESTRRPQMVSRMLSRKYSLPSDTKKVEKVVSK